MTDIADREAVDDAFIGIMDLMRLQRVLAEQGWKITLVRLRLAEIEHLERLTGQTERVLGYLVARSSDG